MVFKNFAVKNFRCLGQLNLRDLKRLNVIVGRNNTGKTALLEALFFHSAANNPTMALNLRMHRGFSGEMEVSKISLTELWRDLFRGFDIAKHIEFESEDASGKRRRSVIFVGPQDGQQLTMPAISGSSFQERSAPLTIEYTDANGKLHVSSLLMGPDGRPELQNPSRILDYLGIILPAYRRVSQEEDAERLDKVVTEKRKDQILKLAQTIEPRLVDLVVGLSAGKPVVMCDVGLPRLAPLPVLGEGTHKLVSMALAIEAARAGVVMLDEAENGLYYDSQKQFWSKLHKLAVTNDVQLFVTSHSRECLEALETSAADDAEFQADVKVIRLAKDKGEVYASEYEFAALQASLAAGFEIR
ncbi:MAG: AAA family ATPase [Acidobacteria bacterium]|nr:AAA family ATPase [Acidobacteriota bacterium]